MTMYIKPYRRAHQMAHHRHQHHQNQVHVPMDVSREEDDYVIEMIVPGLEPEALEIEIVENTVAVEGEFPAADEDIHYLRQERPAGKFRRVVKLPKMLDVEAAQADLKQGVLTLRIPVAEEARPRTIQVKAK